MTTITREQAQKIIEAADEVITALAGTNEDVHHESDNMPRLWDDLNDRYAPPEVVRELARIALASLDADSNSHPAHGPLSNYRLHRISDILSKAAAQSDGGNIGYAMSDAVKAIDELLEGRKVEPMAWLWTNERLDKQSVSLTDPADDENTLDAMACGWKHQPFYTTPAAPVEPECFKRLLHHAYGMTMGHDWNKGTMAGHHRDKLCQAVDACRAAMLQGDKS